MSRSFASLPASDSLHQNAAAPIPSASDVDASVERLSPVEASRALLQKSTTLGASGAIDREPSALFLRACHDTAGWGRGEVVSVRTETLVFVVSEGSFDGVSVKAGDRLKSVTLFTARGRAFEGAATVDEVFARHGKRALRIRCDHSVNVALTHEALEERRLRRVFADRAQTLGGGQIPNSIHAFISALACDLKAWSAQMDAEQLRMPHGHDANATLQRLLHVAAPPLSAHLRLAANSGRALLGRTTPKEALRATAYIQSALAPWLGRSKFAHPGVAPLLHALDGGTANGIDAFGAALDRYFAEEPGVIARRHQDALFADRIEAAVRQCEHLEILALDESLAEPLALVLARAPQFGPRLAATVVTRSPLQSDALARALSPLANRCEMKLSVEASSPLDVTQRRFVKHRYDLILAGSAFDAVSDRLATERLVTFSSALSDDGTLLAATTAHTSPSRFALEVFANRRQRYRSADSWANMGDAVCATVPFALRCAIEQEPLGIQLLLRLARERN